MEGIVDDSKRTESITADGRSSCPSHIFVYGLNTFENSLKYGNNAWGM